MAFNYQTTAVSVVRRGHTIEVEPTGENGIEVEGARYQLLQFHFHTPSEHTLAGQSFDMEIHFVHQGYDSAVAVVGVLVRRGRAHPVLDVLAEHIAATRGQAQGLDISAIDVLPSTRQTVRYDGSLTTPPCSQGVKWLLLTTPIEASDAQLAAFRSVLGKNNRPVQPLNGREVLIATEPAQP